MTEPKRSGPAAPSASLSGDGHGPEVHLRWATVEIRRVEDLKDAVYGAGLEATQYSSGELTGALSVIEHRDTVYTLAQLGARIGIRGPLSRDRITFAIGLRQPEGSRQWMREVYRGSVGTFMPGEEHDGLHMPGSCYVTMAMSRDVLEEIAEDLDLMLDRDAISASGVHPRRLGPEMVEALWHGFGFGEDAPDRARPVRETCERALRLALIHMSRPPRGDLLKGPTCEYSRIVARARDYMMAHLNQPIAVGDMARAAYASHRTLYRAFDAVLGETPASYVRRVRLHRIREGLAPPDEIACSVSRVAYRNGMPQLGRMARWYRQVFGELPSETLAEVRAGRARRRVVEVVRAQGLGVNVAP